MGFIIGILGEENKILTNKMANLLSHRSTAKTTAYIDEQITLIANTEKCNIAESEEGFLAIDGYLLDSVARQTQVEQLLELLEQKKFNNVASKDGSFSGAYWNKKQKKLFLFTDALGNKAMYYTKTKNNMYFAPETKAISLSKAIHTTVSKRAVMNYFDLRFQPNGKTIYNEINRVEPGKIIEFLDRKQKIVGNWNLYQHELDKKKSYFPKRLSEIIKESVQNHLMTKKACVLLSSGMDSIAVAAAIKETGVIPSSYTFHYDKTGEHRQAEELAAELGIRNTQVNVIAEDIPKNIDKMIWHMDVPIKSQRTIPLYIAYKKLKNKEKHVFTGDGGDIFFKGRKTKIIKQNKGKEKPEHIFLDFQKYSRNVFRESFFKNEYNRQEINGLKEIFSSKMCVANKLQYVLARWRAPYFNLLRMENCAAAFKLIPHHPLMNIKIAELSFSIPPKLKEKSITGIDVYRDAIKKWVPKEILKQNKGEILLPLNDWFNGELKGYAEDILESKEFKARGYFDKNKIKKLLNTKNHTSELENKQGYVLWSLLSLEKWHNIFVDNK